MKTPVWQSDKLFCALIENSSDAFALADPHGNILYRSPSAKLISGIPDSKMVSASLFDRIWPEDLKSARKLFVDMLNHPGKRIPFQIRVEGKDGKPQWIDGNGVNWLAKPGLRALVFHFRDGTQAKEAAAALEESERRFRSLFENAQLAVFQSTPDGKVIRVNTEFARMFGYLSPEDVLKSVRDVETDLFADPARRREIIRLRQKDPHRTTFENLYRRKDGSNFWGRLTVQYVTGADGKALYFEGFIEDISRGRALDEELRESEEKFRSIFQNSTTGLALVGLDGRYLMVNPALSEMLGYSAEELLAVDFFKITHPDDVEISRKSMLGALEGKGKSVRFDKRYLHKDGRTVWAEVASALVYDAHGKPSHFITQVTDITRRKLAEEALRESEQRFKTVSELTSDYIFRVVVKKKGDWLLDFASQQFQKETGRSIEAARTVDKWKKIVHPDDIQRMLDFGKTVEAGKTGSLEVRSVRADGRMRWVNILARPEWDERHEKVVAIVGAVKDITERKQAEENLAESEKQFRTLIELSPDPIFIHTEGMISYVNSAGLALLGATSPGQVVGKMVFDIVCPEYHEKIKGGFAEAVEKHSVVPLHEEKYLRMDGTSVDVETIVKPFLLQGKICAQVISRDITERKRAEETLRESEERYRNLFQNSLEGIGLSKGNKVIDANRALLEIFGYDNLTEFTGIPLLDNVAPASRDLIREYLAKVRKGEPHENRFTYQIVRKDGAIRDIDISVGHFKIGDDVYTLSTFRDITEQKRADEMLRESEEKYRLLFDLSPDSIAVYQEGKVIYANPSTLRLLGMESPEEIIGKPMLDFVHPDYREMVIRRSRQQEANGKSASPIEEKFIRRDGSSVDVEVLAAPFQFRGKPSHLVISRDITERKRADDMLREKEERFRATFENANVGVCIVGLDGRLLQVNRRMCQIFGYNREEMERMTVNTIAHPEDTDISPAFIQQAVAGETEQTGFDKRYIHRDGHVIRGHVSSSLVRDSQGNPLYFISHVQDITERKQAEESLRDLALRHETLLSAIPEIVMEVDPNKVYTWANPAGKEFFGDDVIGKEAAFYFEGEQDTYRKVQPLFEGEEGTIYVESWQRRRDGEKRLLGWWCKALKDEHGKVTGSLSTARDITEQRTAEEKIENLSRFPEENPNPVMRMTPEGVLLYANPSSRPFLDYWDIGIGQIVPEECRIILREVFAANQGKEIEKNLGTRIYSCVMTPFVGGGYVNVYARDITDRKRADESLARQTEELRQRNQELARLNDLTERRLQQLAAMRTVDMAISSSFKSELVMDILLEQLTSQLKIHAADILIFHPAMQGFRYFCGRGFYSTPSSSEYLRLTDSYAGRATQERRMIKVARLDEKTDQPKIFPKIAKEGFVAYFCLPLIAKGQIKGVMEICHREPLELGPEEDSFLEMMAGQAAIAVDNAEMFEHLQSSRDELQLAFNSTLMGWARALEQRNHESEGETQRGADLAMRLAQILGESENDLNNIYRGAILHDVGMMSVPDSILLKPGPLTSEEWTIVRQHPQIAYDILSPVLFLRPSLDIPHCHHERWDGSGYPLGYQGEHIPLAARIFAVVDVWDALRSDRPYRKAWTEAKAGEYIRSQSEKLFDPAVVQAFFRLIGG